MGVTVNLRCLNLSVLVLAALSAAAQGVDKIPVTQAGLVNDSPFGSPQPLAAATPQPAAATNPLAVSAQTGVMSPYVVREIRAQQFRNRDIYTKAGLEELSFREHPGLRVGNFRNLNAKPAYDLFLDEERVENLRDFRDTAFAMAVGGDPAEAKMILEETRGSGMRDGDTPERAGDLADVPPPQTNSLLTNFEELRLTLVSKHF